MISIVCMKWGDLYTDEHVENLKAQCEEHCSYPFTFYCLTDNPTKPYHIEIPKIWDHHYDPAKNYFWAYRKIFLFMMDNRIPGDEFLFLDLDVKIHQDLDYFFKLDMEKPWIVYGYWNDPEICKKNYVKMQSTPINSSIIRWNKGQCYKIYDHVEKNLEPIFFTYPTLDNYLNHRWYDIFGERESFFSTFERGVVYSWLHGATFSSAAAKKMNSEMFFPKFKVCLFNGVSDKGSILK